MQKKRDSQIDTIKGLLIILVIIGHAVIPNECNIFWKDMVVNIYLFHLALFFMYSTIFTKEFSFEYLLKRIKKIIIPFVLWYFIKYYIISSIIYTPKNFDIAKNIQDLIIGNVYTCGALWFLTCLFLLNIILSIYKTDFKYSKITRIVFLFISAIVIFNTTTIREIFHSELAWGIDSAFYFLPICIVSYYLLNKFIAPPPKQKNTIFYICITVTIIGFIILNHALEPNIAYNNHSIDISGFLIPGGSMYFVYTTFLIGIFGLSRFIPANKFLSYIGKHTLVIFVLNCALRDLINPYIYNIINYMNADIAFLFILIIYIAFCLAVPILLSGILCKISDKFKILGVKEFNS